MRTAYDGDDIDTSFGHGAHRHPTYKRNPPRPTPRRARGYVRRWSSWWPGGTGFDRAGRGDRAAPAGRGHRGAGVEWERAIAVVRRDRDSGCSPVLRHREVFEQVMAQFEQVEYLIARLAACPTPTPGRGALPGPGGLRARPGRDPVPGRHPARHPHLTPRPRR
ncbi:hypothetical protein HBB16_09925 [Pseudonocardia sp. MCCB 268]|nr:hypothetical protein [Pseudonocardia cytotoxica]